MSAARYEAALQKRLGEEIERIRDALDAGTPKDFPEYRWYAGQIVALKRVLNEFLDEVTSKINEG